MGTENKRLKKYEGRMTGFSVSKTTIILFKINIFKGIFQQILQQNILQEKKDCLG